MRVESDKPAKGDSGGWIHRNGEQTDTLPRAIPEKKKRLTDSEMHAKWAPHARNQWRNAGKDVERLAKELGVACWALDELRVGYGELAGRWCWSFPEWNARRQVVGISRRLTQAVNGTNKMQAKGSRRGLNYAANWLDYSGPIFIVEGGSDTAAALTLGLCVIGRPSNVGGLAYLMVMLRGIERDRRIVVLGERDRKRHIELAAVAQQRHKIGCRGCQLCWPGQFGARQTAKKLRERLGRRVEWWMCPDKAKDLRGWLNSQSIDVEDTDSAFALGRVFK